MIAGATTSSARPYRSSRWFGFSTMALATCITLPADAKPDFPHRCIVCTREPDSTVRITHGTVNPLVSFFVPFLMILGRSTVAVPICRGCKSRFRLQRWGRYFIGAAISLAAVWLIYPHFKGWSRTLRNLAAGGLALLAASPFFVFQVIWPPYIDTTADRKSIDYEFADLQYAAEFLELNAACVVKSDVRPADETERNV